MRAVEALTDRLKTEGVDVVLGQPAGANLPIYRAFYDAGIGQRPDVVEPPRRSTRQTATSSQRRLLARELALFRISGDRTADGAHARDRVLAGDGGGPAASTPSIASVASE
jgi:hypothetical protein